MLVEKAMPPPSNELRIAVFPIPSPSCLKPGPVFRTYLNLVRLFTVARQGMSTTADCLAWSSISRPICMVQFMSCDVVMVTMPVLDMFCENVYMIAMKLTCC